MYAYLTVTTERVESKKLLYKKIERKLADYGFENSNDFLSYILTTDHKVKPQDDKDFHRKTLKKIKKSSLLVADISFPSVTLGTLIEFAINNNIPVLCICDVENEKDIPTLLKKYNSSLFTLLTYSQDKIEERLDEYLEKFKKTKIRFNAEIDPEMDNYLTWVSKKRRMSKADLFRIWARDMMHNDKEYQEHLER